MDEIAYSLPYAQGLQLIWDAKISNDEMIVAMHPTKNANTAMRKKKFNNLLG